MEFNPKKEKSAKKVFKLISFEFAHAEDENDGIPELGLSTFQVRIKLNAVSMLIFPNTKRPNTQIPSHFTSVQSDCLTVDVPNC